MDTWRLDMLPDDVLFIIFDYCDLCDFAHLDKVCKRFYYIIHSDVIWNRYSRNLLVTNQVSEQFRKRCNLLLSSYSKYFVSQNWVQGSYQERILQQQDKLYSQLQLTSDRLWWRSKNMIFGFDRQETTHQKSNTVSCDKTFSEIEEDIKPIESFFNWRYCVRDIEPIKRFILWRDYIVTGHRDGSIMWQAESPIKNEYNRCYECIIKKRLLVHPNQWDYLVLDATSNVIVSAYGCEYAIIRVENSLDIDSINNDNIVRKEICEADIQALAIHPLGTILSVVITSDDTYPHSEMIYHIDLEHDFKMMKIHTSDTTNMLWEDPNTLLMCICNTIQKWDFRVNDYVSTWRYPEYNYLRCISSDHHNTMITGSDYAKAVLWDQRMPKLVQIYCMPIRNKKFPYTPIRSLQFDSTNLYCATGQFLYELDFSKRG